MPTMSPVEPTMVPADRSNSPPIMSRATAIAMIPNSAEESSQVATPPAVTNASVIAAKKQNTATAATAAPTSGRRSNLVSRLTVTSRCVSCTGGESTAMAHLVPRSANCLTLAALSLVTKPGPEYTGRPPPTSLPLRTFSAAKTTGR